MEISENPFDQLMKDHSSDLAAADPELLETVLKFFDRRYSDDGELAIVDIMMATNPDFSYPDAQQIVQLVRQSVLLPLQMKKEYIRDAATWERVEIDKMLAMLRSEPALAEDMQLLLGDDFPLMVQHREAEWNALTQLFVEDHHNVAKAVRSYVKATESTSFDDQILNAFLSPFNDEFVKALARNPNDIYRLTPREFEKLIAALLSDLGWQVELTPQTKDGGKDIIATIPFGTGKLLGIVECKRYSPEQKVGIDIVERFVYTIREKTKASLGMMMTTSFFTKGAWDVTREHSWQLHLNDFDKVSQLLKNFGSYQSGGNSGLWIFPH